MNAPMCTHCCPLCGYLGGLHWCDAKVPTVLRDGDGNAASERHIPADFPMPEAPANAAPDMVNHPPHYTAGAVECIDAIRAALGDDGLVAYCRGNAIKYLWRTGKKGDAVQDMEKAVWYITKAVEVAREDR